MKHTKIDVVRARWTTVRWGENKQDVIDAGDSLCTTLSILQSQNAELLEALKLAFGPVEWLADTIDADLEDHERKHIVDEAIRKASQ